MFYQQQPLSLVFPTQKFATLVRVDPLLQRAPLQSSGILPWGGWSNEHHQVDYPDKESVVPILWNIIEMNILIIKLRDEKKKNGKIHKTPET